MEFNEEEFYKQYRRIERELFPLLVGFETYIVCEECGEEFLSDSLNPMRGVSDSPEEWLSAEVEKITEAYKSGKPTKKDIDRVLGVLWKCKEEDICIDDRCPECQEGVELTLADTVWDYDARIALEKLEKILPVRDNEDKISYLKDELEALIHDLNFLYEGCHLEVDCENDLCGAKLPPVMKKEELDKWSNLIEGAFTHDLDPLFVAEHMESRVMERMLSSDRVQFKCSACGHTESVGYEDSTFEYDVYNSFLVLKEYLQILLEE